MSNGDPGGGSGSARSSSEQRAKTRRNLAYAGVAYLFGGGLLLAGLSMVPGVEVDKALEVFVLGVSPAGIMLGYFKGRDSAA